jgi:hypothetical protein
LAFAMSGRIGRESQIIPEICTDDTARVNIRRHYCLSLTDKDMIQVDL